MAWTLSNPNTVFTWFQNSLLKTYLNYVCVSGTAPLWPTAMKNGLGIGELPFQVPR